VADRLATVAVEVGDAAEDANTDMPTERANDAVRGRLCRRNSVGGCFRDARAVIMGGMSRGPTSPSATQQMVYVACVISMHTQTLRAHPQMGGDCSKSA
jgi:hypothetical protein